MEQESEFFAALESAATYTVDGDFIELRNADDAIAVHMVRELEISFAPPAPAVPTGRVTAPNGVNVRTGPGTNFPVHRRGAVWQRGRNHRPQCRRQLVGSRGACRAGRHGVGFG